MVFALSDVWLSGLIALATLAGAAVGGVIAASVNLRVEERRIARDEQRARAEDCAAAREVWLELENARWTFATALEDGVWRATKPSTRAWDEHRGRLAAVLPLQDWLVVAQAVDAVEWERAHPQEVADPLTDPARRTSVEDTRDKLVNAAERLRSQLEETARG
jgi:hypothetical protein